MTRRIHDGLYYRFVWTKPNMPDVVFYVGSGLNLNGPKLSGIKTPSGVHRGYRTVPASTLSKALSIKPVGRHGNHFTRPN